MLNIKTKQVVSHEDWDNLVEETYGKPYRFQQQNGCQERGNFTLKIPEETYEFENDSIPEVVNGDEMGVSFAAWLARDPSDGLKDERYKPFMDQGYKDSCVKLFWHRNFYPNIQMIANDLYEKELVPAGELTIEIDW